MIRRTQAVYVISVAAELAGMHPQTLRIYERRGLVRPARTQGGNRRYSDADIETLRRIAELAADGMNLEGIRRVMQLEAENQRLRAELDEVRKARDSASLVPIRQPLNSLRRPRRPRRLNGCLVDQGHAGAVDEVGVGRGVERRRGRRVIRGRASRRRRGAAPWRRRASRRAAPPPRSCAGRARRGR